jgi:hypothetical protein
MQGKVVAQHFDPGLEQHVARGGRLALRIRIFSVLVGGERGLACARRADSQAKSPLHVSPFSQAGHFRAGERVGAAAGVHSDVVLETGTNR